MSGAATELDKRGETIRRMFGDVAPRYDLLNRLLSVSLDRRWRRHAARALELREGERALDLCCGTGDQALELSGMGARVAAADFCLPMLALAETKYARVAGRPPDGLAGDALRLPFADASFDAATAAFGLRNVADLDAALAEIARVLRPGGRVALLEFALPRRQPIRGLYSFYFRSILPKVGALLSPRGSAYAYLPASVVEFPQREGFTHRMLAAGFAFAEWRDLSLGTVALYTGRVGARGGR